MGARPAWEKKRPAPGGAGRSSTETDCPPCRATPDRPTARAMERRDWAVPVRRLLIDNDPGVRIAASDALAEIGPPAVAMNLRDLLSDQEPAVRLASLRALRAVVPLDEALRYVYPLQGEQDPDVLAELRDMRNS